MPDSSIDDDWLVFDSWIEVVSLIEKDHLYIVDRNILKHILLMQLCKSNDDDVISIDLANMIELRSVISSIAHFVKLMKWDQIDSKILTKYNITKSH